MSAALDLDLLKTFGQIAAPAGLAIGTFLYLGRDIVAKNIFPKLTPQHAYHVVIVLAFMAWTVALAGIASWTYVSTRESASSIASKPTTSEARVDVRYKTCRLQEFGVERWGKTEVTEGSSGWRGGGQSQPDWCRELLSSFVRSRSITSEYTHEIVASSENNKMTFDRHARYNYFCRIRVNWIPIYNEREDAKCGTL